MSCEELSEELSAYLDGELSPRERAALKAHLERCSRCREELMSLRAVSQLVGSLPQVQPSQAFSQALGREISAHGRRRWLRPIPLFAGDLIPGLAVAALLLIALTVAFVIPRFTSPRRTELAEPLVTRDEVPAGPEPVVEKLGRAELEHREAEPGDAREMRFVAGEAPSGVSEAPPAAAEPLAERADTEEAYDYTRGRGMLSDLHPESDEEEAGGLKADRSAGFFARKGDTDTLAQSSRVTSSAVRKVEEDRAAKAAPPARLADEAAERLTLAAQKPAFHTVVLHCSATGPGHAAFQKALDEFQLLSTRGADQVRTKPMNEEERRDYSRIYFSLLQSPDVIILKEIRVLASDAELIRAVFADKTDLTYADPNTDVDRLRRILTSTRSRPRARKEPPRSVGIRGAWEQARQRADIPTRPEQELVQVILALKRQPEPPPPKAPTLQRAAPARAEPSEREGP